MKLSNLKGLGNNINSDLNRKICLQILNKKLKPINLLLLLLSLSEQEGKREQILAEIFKCFPSSSKGAIMEMNLKIESLQKTNTSLNGYQK